MPPHVGPLDVGLFAAFAMASAVVFTWVFNNTKGSVLIAILAHGAINTPTLVLHDVFPVPSVADGITDFVSGLGGRR